jgi:hypothetical protein
MARDPYLTDIFRRTAFEVLCSQIAAEKYFAPRCCERQAQKSAGAPPCD